MFIQSILKVRSRAVVVPIIYLRIQDIKVVHTKYLNEATLTNYLCFGKHEMTITGMCYDTDNH